MNISLIKKQLSLLLLSGLIVITSANAADSTTQPPQPAVSSATSEMVVYKSASCGCCGDWVKHMEENGFKLKVHNTSDLNSIKQKAGLTPRLASCHTAFIDGYVIEGHVPANDVKRLLSEKPNINGLTVPGMPAGANVPGMEVSPENAEFDVLGFKKDGTVQRWSHYE
ncbi:DUF411 domain-containing protein [Alkalimarinus coralli]|uniref:DUF411 domain-containing protein n=1 Tax=Alkalimarinus coralli TaxID=2935863 RepID=UPI00202AF229|nr:DUF411 domain-containing protein [Alkalimarinus coralli]